MLQPLSFWLESSIFYNYIMWFRELCTVCNHGLRGRASPVLTATGLVNGRWQFSTPTESTPLNRSPKNLAQVNTLPTPTAVPNLVHISPWGLLGEWVKYKWNFIFLFMPFCFGNSHTLSDASTDFCAWWLRWRSLAQGCAFFGFRWYCSPFRG